MKSGPGWLPRTAKYGRNALTGQMSLSVLPKNRSTHWRKVSVFDCLHVCSQLQCLEVIDGWNCHSSLGLEQWTHCSLENQKRQGRKLPKSWCHGNNGVGGAALIWYLAWFPRWSANVPLVLLWLPEFFWYLSTPVVSWAVNCECLSCELWVFPMCDV